MSFSCLDLGLKHVILENFGRFSVYLWTTLITIVESYFTDVLSTFIILHLHWTRYISAGFVTDVINIFIHQENR